MRPFLFLLLLLLLCIFETYAQSTYVLYGERDLDKAATNLYFDKDGLLYPSYTISNASLLSSNGSLKEWYSTNEKLFVEIAKKYNCSFERYSNENCAILNDSIGVCFTNLINNKSSNSIVFLIHGFRKAFVASNQDRDSPTDFNTLATTFKKYTHSTSTIVAIYWDGLYDCCFSSNIIKNAPLFRLFELAQENAEKTGNALKKIIANVSKDTISIITHSLGAKIAFYSTLSIASNTIKTPSSKRVNICLIAPAISPELILANYLKRNSTIDLNTDDNYHLYIVYNEKDFALKKKENKMGLFGPGPYKFGNTSLGCNYNNAAIKLQTNFKNSFKGSSIVVYNLTSVGKCHGVNCYCNSDNLKEVFTDMQK